MEEKQEELFEFKASNDKGENIESLEGYTGQAKV